MVTGSFVRGSGLWVRSAPDPWPLARRGIVGLRNVDVLVGFRRSYPYIAVVSGVGVNRFTRALGPTKFTMINKTE
jgi:hypothetical protein